MLLFGFYYIPLERSILDRVNTVCGVILFRNDSSKLYGHCGAKTN